MVARKAAALGFLCAGREPRGRAARNACALACLLAGVAAIPGVARADEAAAVDWKERTSGRGLLLGGGAEALSFFIYPTAALAYVEGALDVRLSKGVDFRASQSLGFGGGVGDGPYFLCLPALRLAFRFHVVPWYVMWLGYEGRVGIGAYTSSRFEPVGVLPLHGPDLSLASFRFGSRGQFEIDHDGGVFLAPIWGYHFGLTVRYSFEK